ncbi:MAG: SDR family oxidoreductase [Candidatus Pacebacteria bacterium]|nr:SDR family oxidoreductase [Candidatus Paceibacterota bacterium]PIR61244.1 MAG: hypothetical protein COU68_00450 [Candidatus Pacebacteria bacterium CG10_big_fil_rev_8_21_14_0_10_45_6]
MKNVLITGASTGIGRATAIALAKHGFSLFITITARSEAGLNKTKQLVEEVGGEAKVILADLSDIGSVNQLIKTVKSETKSLQAIVNIAGIWHDADTVFADTDFADFSQQTILDTFAVGFTAPTILVHGLLPLMSKGSQIVNLSGTFENGAKGWLPYYASKRALEDLTVGLSQELAEQGIGVNAVSPSDTATESYAKFFPQYLDESVEPELVAQEITRFCQPENKITGQVLVVKKDQEPDVYFHC